MRRRLYIGISVLGIGIQMGIWVLNFYRAVPDPVTTVTNPMFTGLSSWVIWWMACRRPVETVNWVGLTACGLVIVLRAVATPLLGGAELLTALQDLYWLLVVVSVIAFLTVDYRRAIGVTATFYLAGTLLPWAVLAAGGAALSSPARLGQLQLLCGIALITLCSLAWYREHFQRGRDELRLTQKLAATDALTGLNNRHALYPRLGELLGGLTLRLQPPAAATAPFCLLLIDVDHFKRINDQLGHGVGDEVLRQVARTLQGQLRPDDLLGRWGGEEFLVALPGAQEDQALEVAERLRRAVAQADFGTASLVTVSVGLSEARPGDVLEAVVARADAALYEAKRSGRDRVACGPGNDQAPALVSAD
ncbi:hypothetical protein CVO96_18420 [Deinococcus koreensis]|uniref:GGDEF domain-containing protein n=1 Tax=Deinococcus koreensis TaxID=2054903 RepID=A0A2K3UTS7_9DEIO|nr:hypothetical protein CVO96_18420 [Deinococcus koreensis]